MRHPSIPTQRATVSSSVVACVEGWLRRGCAHLHRALEQKKEKHQSVPQKAAYSHEVGAQLPLSTHEPKRISLKRTFPASMCAMMPMFRYRSSGMMRSAFTQAARKSQRSGQAPGRQPE